MTLPLYPASTPVQMPGLSYTVKWSPVFFNQTYKALSGASIDIGLASTPLWNFELTYNVLRGAPNFSEFNDMLGFYTSVFGSQGRFLFDNPDDDSRTANFLGIGTGFTSVYTFIRAVGGFAFSGATDAVGQATGTINIYVNGVLKTLGTDYTLQLTTPMANTVTFTSPPALGTSITADFSFFYYCRFADDTLTFEKFVDKVWSLQSVKIQSCRKGA